MFFNKQMGIYYLGDTYNIANLTNIQKLLHFIVPGIHVSVVNSYAAASLLVPVSVVNKVLLPTLGNPTNPTLVSPLFVTSNPRPASLLPALLPPGPLISSLRNLASLAFSVPR